MEQMGGRMGITKNHDFALQVRLELGAYRAFQLSIHPVVVLHRSLISRVYRHDERVWVTERVCRHGF